ncbi:hypothetical protein HMPREF1548_05507 [Clostridium sp. KLE 1755]|nr:hypothetical protein HMPREF1548_05507 [Clostridium sp. KLE 1755]
MHCLRCFYNNNNKSFVFRSKPARANAETIRRKILCSLRARILLRKTRRIA